MGLFCGASGKILLGTTEDGSRVCEDILFKYADAKEETSISPIVSKIHGHPNEGLDREIHSMESDVYNCRMSPEIQSYVYFPMSGNIYKVFGNGAQKVSNYRGWKGK